MKKYILLAGVNGAGKSTLYRLQRGWSGLPKVNTDDIVRELGRWDDFNIMLQAGKAAIRMVKYYFDQGITFNQETTLCGKTILKNIRKAKELGYIVEIHYVGVETVEIAKERIAYRVSHGGHGIPNDDVERRYIESFKALKEIMGMIDLLVMYDNSIKFRRFAIYKKGDLVRLSSRVPDWYNKYIM